MLSSQNIIYTSVFDHFVQLWQLLLLLSIITDAQFELLHIFTTWHYASAVYAVVVCLSVRLSVHLSVCYKPALYQNA